MIKTVLVTGANGFIGSHLIEDLLDNNYHVVVLLRSLSNTSRIKKNVGKIKVYYSDKGKLESVFKENNIDCVMHLATKYLKKHENVEDVAEMVDVNIKFPTMLCQMCVQYGVRYFINTGTFFEYKIKKTPLTENDKKHSYNLYAASKISFTEILKYYSDNYDFKVIEFKLFAPFGDRDNEKLMAFLVKSLVKGDKIEFSGGEQKWNFTYVKDVTQAYICALLDFNKIDKYEIFNVGYSKAHSIKEIAKKLEKISKNKKFDIAWGAKPYVENEIFYVNCDNSKLKKILKWRPKYNINYGLKKTYEYFSKRAYNR